MWRETEAWVTPTSASHLDRGTTPGNKGAFWMSSPAEPADNSSSSATYQQLHTRTAQLNPVKPRIMSYHDKLWCYF